MEEMERRKRGGGKCVILCLFPGLAGCPRSLVFLGLHMILSHLCLFLHDILLCHLHSVHVPVSSVTVLDCVYKDRARTKSHLRFRVAVNLGKVHRSTHSPYCWTHTMLGLHYRILSWDLNPRLWGCQAVALPPVYCPSPGVILSVLSVSLPTYQSIALCFLDSLTVLVILS